MKKHVSLKTRSQACWPPCAPASGKAESVSERKGSGGRREGGERRKERTSTRCRLSSATTTLFAMPRIDLLPAFPPTSVGAPSPSSPSGFPKFGDPLPTTMLLLPLATRPNVGETGPLSVPFDDDPCELPLAIAVAEDDRGGVGVETVVW